MTARWLVVAALVLASAAVDAASGGVRPASSPPVTAGVGIHPATVLDAIVTPVVSTVVHSQAPRALPAVDPALAASALLTLVLASVIAGASRHRTPAHVALPRRRGPPHRLLPR